MNEKAKTLEDYRQQIVDRDKENVINIQQNIMESVFDANFAPNAQLPEDVFEYYFYDFFRHSNDEKYKNSPILLKWVELAGGYCHEVDIVNNEGEIIFTVPAITPNGNVNLKGLTDFRLDKLAHNYQDESRFHPEHAVQNLRSHMRSMPHILDNTDPVKDALVRWRNIFIYFERKKQNREQQEDKQNENFVNSINNSSTTDTVNYNNNILKNEDLGINYDD